MRSSAVSVLVVFALDGLLHCQDPPGPDAGFEQPEIRCEDCQGSGQVVCPDCGKNKVKGVKEDICPRCGGQGKQPCAVPGCTQGFVTCSACKGEGMVTETYKVKAGVVNHRQTYRTEKRKVDCRLCQNGRVACRECDAGLQKCTYCLGKKKAKVDCTLCQKTGMIPCPRCNGSGKYQNPNALELIGDFGVTEAPSVSLREAKETVASLESQIETNVAQLQKLSVRWEKLLGSYKKAAGEAAPLVQALAGKEEPARGDKLGRSLKTARSSREDCSEQVRDVDLALPRYQQGLAKAKSLLLPLTEEIPDAAIRSLTRAAEESQELVAQFKSSVEALDESLKDLESQTQETRENVVREANETEKVLRAKKELDRRLAQLQQLLLGISRKLRLPDPRCELVDGSNPDSLTVQVEILDRDAEDESEIGKIVPSDEYRRKLPALLTEIFRGSESVGSIRIQATALHLTETGVKKPAAMARFLTTRSQWQEISEVGYPDDVEKQFEALQRISRLSEPSERDGGFGEMAPSALIYLLCAFFVALIVIFVLRTRAMARL